MLFYLSIIVSYLKGGEKRLNKSFLCCKMDLERKNYMPENYGEVYEDEIDLKELFLVLWRNKVKILIVAFICMVLKIIYISLHFQYNNILL